MNNKKKISDKLKDELKKKNDVDFDTILPIIIAQKSYRRLKKADPKNPKPGDYFRPLRISNPSQLSFIFDECKKKILSHLNSDKEKDIRINIPIIYNYDKEGHSIAIEVVVENNNINVIIMNSVGKNMGEEELMEKLFELKEFMDKEYSGDKKIQLNIMKKPVTQMQQRDGVSCTIMSLNNLANTSRLSNKEKLEDCVLITRDIQKQNDYKTSEALSTTGKENLIDPHYIKTIQSIKTQNMLLSKNENIFLKSDGKKIDAKKHLEASHNLLMDIPRPYEMRIFKFSWKNTSPSKKRSIYFKEAEKIISSLSDEELIKLINASSYAHCKSIDRFIEDNHSTPSEYSILDKLNIKLTAEEKNNLYPVVNDIDNAPCPNLQVFLEKVYVFNTYMKIHKDNGGKDDMGEFLKKNQIQLEHIVEYLGKKIGDFELSEYEDTMLSCFPKEMSMFELFLKRTDIDSLNSYINVNTDAFTWLIKQNPEFSRSFLKKFSDLDSDKNPVTEDDLKMYSGIVSVIENLNKDQNKQLTSNLENKPKPKS